MSHGSPRLSHHLCPFALICCMLAACGARSQLPIPEPCDEAGAQRPCSDFCGAGTQLCAAGYWQACEVPAKTKPCSNDCGAGQQICHAGAWQPCVVPEIQRECTGTCGSGTQTCKDNTWSLCDVAEHVVDCSNECGQGTKRCRNGTWGKCQVEHQEKACSSVCGSGKQTCDNNTWSDCDAPKPLPPTLLATVRDFRQGVPADFDPPIAGTGGNIYDSGYVGSLLGDDDTPVYVLAGASQTVEGPDTFYQWYHDVPGVNQTTTVELPLVTAPGKPGLYTYKSRAFFPIDGMLFGNEGLSHNYSFTLVTSAQFTFSGMEKFTFTGDDDVFVFINRHLAIDLGGIHEAETATVDLAARAADLGLQLGNRYSIHIFFAERHPVSSSFFVETSISDLGGCP